MLVRIVKDYEVNTRLFFPGRICDVSDDIANVLFAAGAAEKYEPPVIETAATRTRPPEGK